MKLPKNKDWYRRAAEKEGDSEISAGLGGPHLPACPPAVTRLTTIQKPKIEARLMLEQRKGDWVQTATGVAFWPIDPRPEEVHIEDIAHALSQICRFGGHCLSFYSVAQHSVLVSRALPREYKAWGLLHDASEAYVIDVPRPLKPYLEGYKEAEDRVMDAIARRFGLSMPIPAEVKRVDNAILADEADQLMAPPPRKWTLPEPPLGIDIYPMSPALAREAFLSEFQRIQSATAEVI